VQTVLGTVDHKSLGVTDAHNHVWIESIPGADPTAPVLDEEEKILEELRTYLAAGGESLLGCQPGGCGRNGTILAKLAEESGVNIIACTGFHRRKYYPLEYWLFSASENRIADHFISEHNEGLLGLRPGSIRSKHGCARQSCLVK